MPLASIDSFLYERSFVDEKRLGRLVSSVKRSGVVEPVIVRRWNGGYQLLAGYLRYLACKRAGLERIPAIIHYRLDDVEATDILLVENIHRQDMSDMDVATVLRKYMDFRGFSQREVARRIGVSEAYVSHYMSLLKDTETIRRAVRYGVITEKQARYLRRLPTEGLQAEAVRLVRGKTVRQTALIVRRMLKENAKAVAEAEISLYRAKLKEIEDAEREKAELERRIEEIKTELEGLKGADDKQGSMVKVTVLQERYFPALESLSKLRAKREGLKELISMCNLDFLIKERNEGFYRLEKLERTEKELKKELAVVRRNITRLRKEINGFEREIQHAMRVRHELSKVGRDLKEAQRTVRELESLFKEALRNFNWHRERAEAYKQVVTKREELFKEISEIKVRTESLEGKIANKPLIERRITLLQRRAT